MKSNWYLYWYLSVVSQNMAFIFDKTHKIHIFGTFCLKKAKIRQNGKPPHKKCSFQPPSGKPCIYYNNTTRKQGKSWTLKRHFLAPRQAYYMKTRWWNQKREHGSLEWIWTYSLSGISFVNASLLLEIVFPCTHIVSAEKWISQSEFR